MPRDTGYESSSSEQFAFKIRLAEREDVDAMANIFVESLRNDKTARLLYPHEDAIWSVVVDMIKAYARDRRTQLWVVENERSDTIVGWMSVSLKGLSGEDQFEYCDSTAWAGLQLLREEAQDREQEAVHPDEVRRVALICRLREHNRRGQNMHVAGSRMVLNTVAVDPDASASERREIAALLIFMIEDVARPERRSVWAQIPKNLVGDPEGRMFESCGFVRVGSFELDLNRYANEEQRRRRDWGFQKWTQWVLRL